MGLSQSVSVIATEALITGVVLVAGFYILSPSPAPSGSASKPRKLKKNRIKGSTADKQIPNDASTSVDASQAEERHLHLPGSLDDTPRASPSPSAAVSSKANKKKKGKGTKVAHLDASGVSVAPVTPSAPVTATSAATTLSPPPPPPQSTSSASLSASNFGDSEGWTKVGSSEADLGASTSSLTPAPAPSAAKKKGKKAKAASQTPEASEEARQTLAERLLPKPEPTIVDDMLDEKPAGLARVMRVTSEQKPHPGFSLQDYEDVEQVERGEEEDEDAGWSEVPVKSKKKPASSFASSGTAVGTSSSNNSSETTKKQRQNAAKREAQKAAKAEQEQERIATLARHKRQLENERIKAQYAGSRSKPGGGMTASVDRDGKLVWD